MIQCIKTGLDTLLRGCRIEKNKIVKANGGGVLPGQVLKLLSSLFPTVSPSAREVSAKRRSAAVSKSSALNHLRCSVETGMPRHPAPLCSIPKTCLQTPTRGPQWRIGPKPRCHTHGTHLLKSVLLKRWESKVYPGAGITSPPRTLCLGSFETVLSGCQICRDSRCPFQDFLVYSIAIG